MADPQDELEALKGQVAALTARIYILEQRLGVSAPVRPQTVAPPVTATDKAEPQRPISIPSTAPTQTAPPSFATLSPARPSTTEATQDTSLEKRIGQVWLNRIGIVAVLFGVSYFLKWAFDNNLIGPTGRVLIGILFGIGIILWSERFRTRGHMPFSYSLKAVGIGALYLSFWAAAQYFQPPLISTQIAFIAMVIVTASTITMALAQNAQLLAAFALIGGFSTPAMLSTGENHEIILFSYVCLLDLGVLVIAMVRPWRRLLWGSFLGTQLLHWGWFLQPYYSKSERPITILFAGLFFAIFAVIPLAIPFERSTRFKGPSVTLIVLPLLNAVVFFLALFAMYESERETLTWYALGLAAVYLGLSNAFKRRVAQEEGRVINLIHVAMAIAFITIAVPLKLSHYWITLGWLVESAVLLWIAVRTRTDFLRYLAVSALVLGLFRLLAVDHWRPETLVFNVRFATYLVAIAILAGIVYFGRHYGSGKEQTYVEWAGIGLNLLALIALTGEAYHYFNRQQSHLNPFTGYSGSYRQLDLARNFSYSAIWLVYGVGLMVFGFWKKTAFVRWQALALIAATILKVFTYDVSELDKGYRILSFIALGAVLLGISFIYQRDWLKLSPRSSGKSEGTSA
ncbi:MAG TPA: DUF2339 domain-containing protein [Candidatus Angelobacter sp.]|nr:DUF2339 domain-containing protein [Candidatus Angelobacter sp.]